MTLFDDLLVDLIDAPILEVTIGLHWTAVVADVAGVERCGLASTMGTDGYMHTVEPDVPDAGRLTHFSGREMAGWIRHEKPTMRSLGFAALNALLPRHPDDWVDVNAEAVIAERGAGRTVAMIGHFPFVKRLRDKVGQLYVLDMTPGPDDLPAEAAPDVVPEADVVAITSMTLVNHTLDGLLRLCRRDATVILLGPTTPLHPALFDYGATLISGAVVGEIPPVLKRVRQGANFRQVHKAGVRLVTMQAEGG